MKKILTTFLVIFFILPCFTQDQIEVDSLKIIVKNSSEDTIKIKTLWELSRLYYRSDLNEAIAYANQALEISVYSKNKRFISKSNSQIGICYLALGNYDRALSNLLKALKISTEIDDKNETIRNNVNIGAIYDRVDKFDEALEYYFKALSIYNDMLKEGTPAISKEIQSLFNNIGNVYQTKGELESAVKYYNKGLEYSELAKDYVNLGIINNNLGKINAQIGDYEKALEYLKKSLKIRQDIGDNRGTAVSYYFISEYYQNLKQYDQSLKYAKMALNLSHKTHSLVPGKNAAKILYENYEKLGLCDSAFYYHKIYKNFSDSLLNESTISEMTRTKMKYDNEAKELILKTESQKLRYRYIIILSTLLLGFIILVLLFILSRSRQRGTRLENEKLEKEIELRNKELATNVLYLVKKNEFLDTISKRLLKITSNLKEENKSTIQKIIFDLQESQDKEVWEEFEYRFQQVHSEFYTNLQKKFPDLSPAEIKLAAFLRLNMTTKEISSITGQGVSSIETARYRLRKKLGISNQEINLVSFLLEL